MARGTLIVLALIAVTVAAFQNYPAGPWTDLCHLPPVERDNDFCLASLVRFTYSATSGRCESYNYGGCGGTDNLFDKLKECKQRCGSRNRGQRAVSESRPALCYNLPEVTGHCRISFTRYAYNHASDKCHLFPYGGCAGNANNFKTKNECEATCRPKNSRG